MEKRIAVPARIPAERPPGERLALPWHVLIVRAGVEKLIWVIRKREIFIFFLNYFSPLKNIALKLGL